MKYFGIQQVGNNFLIAVLSSRLRPLHLYKDSSAKKLTFSKKFLFQKKRVVTGLETNNIIVKEFSLHTKKSSIVNKALSLQIKTVFPFGSNPSIVIPISTKSKDYLLYGTTVSKVEKKIRDLEEKRISLHAISCEPAALGRFAHAYFPPYKLSFIVHIEEHKTICAFLKDNLPVFSHTIKIGRNDLLQEISPDNFLDLELIDESKDDPLSIIWTKFKAEITKTFMSLNCSEKIFILIAGTIENTTNLEKFLFKDIGDNILFFGKPKVLNTDYNRIREYAIPIGYCIDTIKNDNRSLQFIQKNCLPTKTFSSLYKKAFYISFLSILLFIVSLQITTKSKKFKNRAITEKLSALKTIDAKIMNRKIYLDDSVSVNDQLNKFHETILKEKESFPYFFKSEYPRNLIAEILDIQGNSTLKSFHYFVESYPTIKKPNAKTLVKVTLALTGSENDIAYFKSNLLKKHFVNQKLKTKYSFEDNQHKISFYLK